MNCNLSHLSVKISQRLMFSLQLAGRNMLSIVTPGLRRKRGKTNTIKDRKLTLSKIGPGYIKDGDEYNCVLFCN